MKICGTVVRPVDVRSNPSCPGRRCVVRRAWRPTGHRTSLFGGDFAAEVATRKELGGELERAIDQLPERQRRVVVLRDALGWSSEEVCNVLELDETNQRVLLHRARPRLRALLEDYKANR